MIQPSGWLFCILASASLGQDAKNHPSGWIIYPYQASDTDCLYTAHPFLTHHAGTDKPIRSSGTDKGFWYKTFLDCFNSE